MKLYRIYTENKNVEGIKGIMRSRFDSYTLIQGEGFWEGQGEPSLIIELIGKPLNAVRACCVAIKKYNKQQAVLLVAYDVEPDLI